ncbi:hypothetical protein [Microbacterium laevaniformans]|uniref:hypothetical protein n=1 Tax=Microbacterium laevaniformans TaxID=36807 RepID=UPI003628540E
MERIQSAADSSHGSVDAFLLVSVQLAGDCAVEVSVEELLAAFHEAGLLAQKVFLSALRSLSALFQRGA